MKKKQLTSVILLVTGVLVLLLNSCKKDDDPTPLTLESLMAGTIDLYGATTSNEVPSNPTITATFSTNVDPTTATNTNITLTRDYDDASIDLTINVSGATITITPTSSLGNGTLYQLNFGASLLSEDALPLEPISLNFSTEGTFVPPGQIAYWNFDDNADDQVGDYDPDASDIIGITYVNARSTNFGKAANFDGDVSIIEIPNGDELMNTDDFTLSIWVKTNSEGHVDAGDNPAGHFVLGLGAYNGFQLEISGNYSSIKMPVQFEFADGTSSTGGDLFFNGDGKTKDNGGWQGTVIHEDLTGTGGVESIIKDKWVHIVYIYNSMDKERMFYVNGELVIMQDYDLWPDDSPLRTVVGMKFNDTEEVENKLAFGFIQSRGGTLWDNEPWGGYDFPTSNHFKGMLDDVRIFHVALSETEVLLLYNSEKP